jgi:hypothetical protein
MSALKNENIETTKAGTMKRLQKGARAPLHPQFPMAVVI